VHWAAPARAAGWGLAGWRWREPLACWLQVPAGARVRPWGSANWGGRVPLRVKKLLACWEQLESLSVWQGLLQELVSPQSVGLPRVGPGGRAGAEPLAERLTAAWAWRA
jgi:hypothetical protein